MYNVRRCGAVLLAVVGLALAVTACGPDAEQTSPPGVGAPAAAPPSAEAANPLKGVTAEQFCPKLPASTVASITGLPVNEVETETLAGTGTIECRYFAGKVTYGAEQVELHVDWSPNPDVLKLARQFTAADQATISDLPELGTQAYQFTGGRVKAGVGVSARTSVGVVIDVEIKVPSTKDKAVVLWKAIADNVPKH